MRKFISAIVVAISLIACGDGTINPTSDTTQTDATIPPNDTTALSEDTAAPGNDTVPTPDATPSDAIEDVLEVAETLSPSTDTGSSEDTPTLPVKDVPPTTAADLLAWLKADSYQSWEAESAPHASTGPHGTVRTFVNPALASSLAAGNPTHPSGAASVKEFHGASGVTGWAVSVKIQSDSDGGKGWYWYETFSTDDDAKPFVDGVGVALCANCHAGGKDYILVPYPLP